MGDKVNRDVAFSERACTESKAFSAAGQKALRSKRIPLYQLVVYKDLAANPRLARALILAGKVLVEDQRVDKPAALTHPEASIRIKGQSNYVSRGGDKLRGGLSKLGVDSTLFRNKVVIDIGAAAGGFSDFALKCGAKTVIALDVGTNQLDWRIRKDPRVLVLEKFDIRDFNRRNYPPIELVLADISFNSLVDLAPAIVASGTRPFQTIMLVKPQFELPSKLVPRGGIVRDPNSQHQAVTKVVDKLTQLGAKNLASAESPVKGRKGNQEIFLYGFFAMRSS